MVFPLSARGFLVSMTHSLLFSTVLLLVLLTVMTVNYTRKKNTNVIYNSFP